MISILGRKFVKVNDVQEDYDGTCKFKIHDCSKVTNIIEKILGVM